MAGQGSDVVFATSDNPRSEDPRAILAEIEPALKATGVRYVIEPAGYHQDAADERRLGGPAADPGVLRTLRRARELR